MKLKSGINNDYFKIFYYENKNYLFPVLALVTSVLLFLIFIMPQLLSFSARKQEVDAETQILNEIKEAQKVVSTSNKELLDSQIETVTKALPPTKDFERILNGIGEAASVSNAQIEGYKFQNQTAQELENNKIPFIIFDVTIIGDIGQSVNFIKELYKTYPVSEVIKVTGSKGSSKITINFYYKALPTATDGETIKVKSMSPLQKKTLNEISEWNDSDGQEIIFEEPEEASASGEVIESPF